MTDAKDDGTRNYHENQHLEYGICSEQDGVKEMICNRKKKVSKTFYIQSWSEEVPVECVTPVSGAVEQEDSW